MNVSQNFPVDVRLGLFFRSTGIFKLLANSAHELVVCTECTTSLVSLWLEGFLCTLSLLKGRYTRVILRSSGPTNARNVSSAEFSPGISKGSVKETRGFFPVTS